MQGETDACIVAAMLEIGPFELYSVVTGSIRLDGGAMFGVVPKVLWDKVTDVDDLNRILLSTRTLLAVDRTHARAVIVDTGCGSKWEPDQIERYETHYDADAIPNALKNIGLSTEDITDVVIGHLHFDHNGGLTYWYDDPGGPTRLCYPQARHWIHRSHWNHALEPHARDRASFLKEDFLPLADAGVLQFVEGDGQEVPFEGLEWFVSHGHTPGQLHPIFGTGSEQLIFIGDLVPTVAHLRLGWVMAYDNEPLTTIAERQVIYRRCLEGGLLLAFPHDPSVGGVSIDGKVERPIVARTLPL